MSLDYNYKNAYAPPPPSVDRIIEIMKVLNDYKGRIKAVMPPNFITVDSFLGRFRTALTASPNLQKCKNLTIYSAVMKTAEYGLLPGIDVYYLPIRGICIFDIGRTGWVKLLFKNGIRNVITHVIYEGDDYTVDFGEDKIKHFPVQPVNRIGGIVAAYAIGQHDYGQNMVLLWKEELDILQSTAPSGDSESSPWVKHPVEMYLKSVVSRLGKNRPIDFSNIGLNDHFVSDDVDGVDGVDDVDDGGGVDGGKASFSKIEASPEEHI